MADEQERTDELLRVSTSDGKYTVIQHASGRTEALRYGEPWMTVTGSPGSNMILALAYDLEEAREDARASREDADAWCRVSTTIQESRRKLARTLRWILKNGFPNEYYRPSYVNEALDDAWEGHRANDPWRQQLGDPET